MGENVLPTFVLKKNPVISNCILINEEETTGQIKLCRARPGSRSKGSCLRRGETPRIAPQAGCRDGELSGKGATGHGSPTATPRPAGVGRAGRAMLEVPRAGPAPARGQPRSGLSRNREDGRSQLLGTMWWSRLYKLVRVQVGTGTGGEQGRDRASGSRQHSSPWSQSYLIFLSVFISPFPFLRIVHDVPGCDKNKPLLSQGAPRPIILILLGTRYPALPLLKHLT